MWDCCCLEALKWKLEASLLMHLRMGSQQMNEKASLTDSDMGLEHLSSDEEVEVKV